METAPLTLSSSLSLLLTSTGHKPTIIINHRNNTTTFHQPSLFPSGHLQVMCGHKCRHVVKAVGINGGEEDDGIRKTRGAVGATVVLACVIGAMCFTRPMCRPALAGVPFSFPWSKPKESTVFPDRTPETLASLLTAHRPRNQREVDQAKKEFYELLNKPRIECPDLKAKGRLVVLSGDKEAAEVLVKKLQAVYEEHKRLRKPDDYELGLALVEMLIFQKNYAHAETLLTELEHLSPNADPKLYKALIGIKRGQRDDEKLWNSYERAVGEKSEIPTTFPIFKARMLKLKRK